MAFFICLVLKLVGAWFLITGIAGLLLRMPKYRRAEPGTRFAYLIPARNEEAVIHRPVASLLAQDYPRELFEVFVLPNNCTDRTAAAASAAGAEIITIRGPVRYKGDVLGQALRDPRLDGFDAICVFDADNVAAPDYLARMNDAFSAGACVAKGRLRVLNARDSAVAGCYALYFGIFDWFFNRSRAALSMSAKLVGTGFAVSLSFLNKAGGWNTGTLAEDAEFSALCAELGEKVWWVPEAVSFDEAPLSFGESLKQRKRWCSGIMEVARLRALALFSAAASGSLTLAGMSRRGAVTKDWRRAVRAFDGAMFLCSPFAQALSPIPPMAALIGIVQSGTAAAAAACAVYLIGLWVCMTFFGGLVALLSGYRDARMLKSVLLFPLFMASWVPLQIVSLFRRTEKWEVLRHGAGSYEAGHYCAGSRRPAPKAQCSIINCKKM